MQLSANGIAKIEGYEGWGRLIKEGPNAGCYLAYQDSYHGHLDKPTIGPGLTEDVHMGLVLTRDECSARFRKELARFEAAVGRLVEVPINQNEYDALVSFAYNCGEGALAKSTILKRLNKGDRTGAASAFAAWNKAGGGVVDGLVQRRASEAALFLKPVEAPEQPAMPQTVTATPEPVSRPTVSVATAVVTAAATLPSVPDNITKSIDTAHAWQTIGEAVGGYGSWLISHPVIGIGLVATVGLLWFRPIAGAK